MKLQYGIFLLGAIHATLILSWEFKSGPLDETRTGQIEKAPAYQSYGPATQAPKSEPTFQRNPPDQPGQRTIRFDDETENTRSDLETHLEQEAERKRLQ